MKKHLASSSETYLVQISDLLALKKNPAYHESGEVLVMVGYFHKKKA